MYLPYSPISMSPVRHTLIRGDHRSSCTGPELLQFNKGPAAEKQLSPSASLLHYQWIHSLLSFSGRQGSFSCSLFLPYIALHPCNHSLIFLPSHLIVPRSLCSHSWTHSPSHSSNLLPSLYFVFCSSASPTQSQP